MLPMKTRAYLYLLVIIQCGDDSWSLHCAGMASACLPASFLRVTHTHIRMLTHTRTRAHKRTRAPLLTRTHTARNKASAASSCSRTTSPSQ